jgi:hypothetical protein
MHEVHCCIAKWFLEISSAGRHMTVISSAHLLLPLARRECSPLEVFAGNGSLHTLKPGLSRLFFAKIPDVIRIV